MHREPNRRPWDSLSRWETETAHLALQAPAAAERDDGQIPAQALDELAAMMIGPVLRPGDPAYETARRVFNPRFDAHPAAIAQCAVEADVSACLGIARRFRVPFRLRASGHCLAGFSTGPGLVVDLARLDDIRIDDAAMTATVGAGCTMGALGKALGARDYDLPLGGGPGVCVAGFMMGGGWSATSRTGGMNCDHVLSLRMMLADGSVVEASEHKRRGLWWAARGGAGGNFGVLLSVTYQLRRGAPLALLYLGWSLADAPGRENAARALMTLQDAYIEHGAAPGLTPQAFFLCSHSGVPWLVVQGAFVGDEAGGNAALAPLLASPGVQTDLDLSQFGQAPPMPKFDRASRYVKRKVALAEWGALVDLFVAAPTRAETMCIEPYGGAIASYPARKSAFRHRDTAFNIYLDVFWHEDAERDAAMAFQQAWCTLMAPLWDGHIYQNFPSLEAPDYRRNYWGKDFRRLLKIKAKYDPARLFDYPQAIKPPDS